MARSRRSAPAPARKPSPAATPAKAPAVQQSAPAPATTAPSQPSVGGGLMATVAEGMAFGTGSAIARHAVNAAVDSFSPSDSASAPAAPAAPAATASTQQTCFNDQRAFTDCLERNTNDIASCQFFLDAYNTCKQQSALL